jgi:multiple sugar transport system permease protein
MRERITPFTLTREAAFYLVLALIGIVMALPFVWTVSTSFKLDEDIFAPTVQLIPPTVTFQHYIEAFTTVPFARYFLNSLFLAVAGVLSNLFFGSLAGYAYARMRFRGRQTMFRLQLLSFMVPGVVTIIPTFIILRSFPFAGGNNAIGLGGTGLLNSYWAIILPGAAGTFAVFLMRQFFLTLPSELGEAARIDGCGEFGIFWRIYMPLCRPALATLGLFTFQAGWNAFLWPLIVLNDPELSTVQMGLQSFTFNHQTDYGALMAASVVATLPTLLLFIFAQRYFVQGISFTGAK